MSDFRKKFALPTFFTPLNQDENVLQSHVLDLGLGFPDYLPPQFVRDAMVEVARSTNNANYQYTRDGGHPRLVKVLSELYSKVIGQKIDPFKEIVITAGGYHALFISILALVDKGDEAIIIEPFFPSFLHIVKTAGGVPRFTTLTLKENTNCPIADGFILDYKHLESIFNEKTKVIVLNTPHNPLGKVFTYEELTKIADLCKKWNVVCISDEVYEWLVFDSKKHIRMASLPGMWERTITIGSAEKTFGATGWNLGWVYGPHYLIENVLQAHLTSAKFVNTFNQEVAAICFEKELANFGQTDNYFASKSKELEEKRNFLINTLTRAGLKSIVSSGGYYLVVDLSQWLDTTDLKEKKEKFGHSALVKWMEENVGVYGFPMAMFYSSQNITLGEKFVRFCFVKSDDYLEKVDKLFKKWNARTNAK